MAYSIAPLERADFSSFFTMSDAELARHGAVRMVADSPNGFPCRVAMDHAPVGSELILLNWTSLQSDGPFRTTYAVFVSRDVPQAAPLVDALPKFFTGRTLSLRAFDGSDMLIDCCLADDEGVDGAIRNLFANPAVAYIMAHFAAAGCFAARIERHAGSEA